MLSLTVMRLLRRGHIQSETFYKTLAQVCTFGTALAWRAPGGALLSACQRGALSLRARSPWHSSRTPSQATPSRGRFQHLACQRGALSLRARSPWQAHPTVDATRVLEVSVYRGHRIATLELAGGRARSLRIRPNGIGFLLSCSTSCRMPFTCTWTIKSI